MQIAICEDRPDDAKRIKYMLEWFLSENCLVAEISCFSSAEAFLDVFKPGMFQIAFMDIYMKEGGLTGMDAARKVAELDSELAIIFTTNCDEFAVPAFKVAVYYIIKPLIKEEFDAAMLKCRLQIQKYAKTISVTSQRQNYDIRLRDIFYIESIQRSCVFNTKSGCVQCNIALEALESRLGGFPFIRCHRSFLVNMIYVFDYKDKEFILKNGSRIPISRSYQDNALKAFKALLRE